MGVCEWMCTEERLCDVAADVHTGVTQKRPKIRFDISEDRLVFHPIAHRIYHKNTADALFVNCNNFTNFIIVFYHFVNLLY
jgi:hypothetical protein